MLLLSRCPCPDPLCALVLTRELVNLAISEIKFVSYKISAMRSLNLKRKKMISTPLMMEKPVRSPMVPPMRLSWASVLIFLSLSMSSKVAVSK